MIMKSRAGQKMGLRTQTKQLLTGLGSAIVAYGLAALLHFLYDWLGQARIVAVFAAVNESTWEHVKILLWSYLLMSIAVYYILKPPLRRLVIARTAGAVVVALLTICVFYIYTGVLGHSVTWFDIASAGIWLLIGELVSLRVLNSPYRIDDYFIVSLALLTLIIVMLCCFTVSPPKIGLFQDPITGLYGLETMP